MARNVRTKVNFGHPQWPTAARNEIESDFRTSKITTSSHFVKKIQKKKKICIDLKWPEM